VVTDTENVVAEPKATELEEKVSESYSIQQN
jgi:hypothetical protein